MRKSILLRISGGTTLAYILYKILLTLLSPLLRIYFSYKATRDYRYTGTLDERYGHYDDRISTSVVSRRIWIHAVSVGEVVGATPIIRNVIDNLPGASLVVSTTTKTGREMLIKTFPNIVTFYFPFDIPVVVRRAVSAIRPDILVLMETELWPNVISNCAKRGANILLLNGRVSDRMASAGVFAASLYKHVFSRIDVLGMQSEIDARRLQSIGAPADKIIVVGNMKFDGIMAALDDEIIHALGCMLNPSKRPLFAAGSTHPGEEEQLLDAFATARIVVPNLLLIIAPRHIERTGEIETIIHARRLSSVRRSSLASDATAPMDIDVIILDTIGELRYLYAVATACFVGGSLIERGGHNVLEPAACGKAPFYGPHIANFIDSVRTLENGGGGRPVADSNELGNILASLLIDDAERKIADEAALRIVLANAGASDRAFELLKKYI